MNEEKIEQAKREKRDIEKELISLRKEITELRKIIENHRHDGHGYAVK